MRLFLLSLSWLSLPACSTPFGFGGEDWGGDVTTDDGRDPGTELGGSPYDPNDNGTFGPTLPTVLAAHAWCADGSPNGLAVDVDGADVWFTHVGFAKECNACAAWTVSPTADIANLFLEVEYVDLDPATCDCDCGAMGIEYVMEGFAEGTWSVVGDEDEATFTIGASGG